MKIAITGASGLLGNAFFQLLTRAGASIVKLDRNANYIWNPTELANVVAECDVIIHAAANTNVEHCEQAPEECYRDNYALTEAITTAASYCNIPVVFISSTGVYGSALTRPYCEYDDAHPTTHHHRSKHLAEHAVLRLGKRNIVIRTGWLFGGSAENPKNFVANRIREAKKSEAGIIYSNREQIGCPTFTQDVVTSVLTLVESKHCGLFNCVNTGTASRFDYVKAIMKAAQIDIEVCPVQGSNFNRLAKVSNNESAHNWRLSVCGLPQPGPWETALEYYIQSDLEKI